MTGTHRVIHILLVAIFVTGLLVSLGSCGRKGPPKPPPGSTYPRVYPSR